MTRWRHPTSPVSSGTGKSHTRNLSCTRRRRETHHLAAAQRRRRPRPKSLRDLQSVLPDVPSLPLASAGQWSWPGGLLSVIELMGTQASQCMAYAGVVIVRKWMRRVNAIDLYCLSFPFQVSPIMVSYVMGSSPLHLVLLQASEVHQVHCREAGRNFPSA